jgi:single-strand DNA-binding protein
MSYQKLIIVGYLGKAPEMRFSASGTAVTSLNVASNRTYSDQDGRKVQETTWWRVSVWGKQAENANNYLQKGSMVLVEGELRPDKETGGPKVFTRNDGTPGASYEVFAHNVRYLSAAQQGERERVNDEDVPF